MLFRDAPLGTVQRVIEILQTDYRGNFPALLALAIKKYELKRRKSGAKWLYTLHGPGHIIGLGVIHEREVRDAREA